MDKGQRVQKNLRLDEDILQEINNIAAERDYSFTKTINGILREALFTPEMQPIKRIDPRTVATDAEGNVL